MTPKDYAILMISLRNFGKACVDAQTPDFPSQPGVRYYPAHIIVSYWVNYEKWEMCATWEQFLYWLETGKVGRLARNRVPK